MKKTLSISLAIVCTFCLFRCDKEEITKSSAKEIISFKFEALTPIVNGSIDANQKQIALVVPFGTSLTALMPTIEVSGKATISPASGVEQNFTNPVIYTVTAEDGSTQSYAITVSVEVPKESAKEITSFKFTSLIPEVVGTINQAEKKIELIVPHGTSLTALTPVIQISEKATILPVAGPQNFTNPITYTVTAEDGSTQTYTVIVIVQLPKSSVKEIISFKLTSFNPVVIGSINQVEKKINLVVPHDTPLSALSPTVEVSAKASLSPQSNTQQNFTNPVTYTVTAEDGSTQEYIVTITAERACLPTKLPGEESYFLLTYNSDHTIKRLEAVDFDTPEPVNPVANFHYTNGKLTRIDYPGSQDYITFEYPNNMIIENHFDRTPNAIVEKDYYYIHYLQGNRITGWTIHTLDYSYDMRDSLVYTYNSAGNITHADGYDHNHIKSYAYDYEYDNKINPYKLAGINEADDAFYLPANLSNNNVVKKTFTYFSTSSVDIEITSHTYDAEGKPLTRNANWDSAIRDIVYTCH